MRERERCTLSPQDLCGRAFFCLAIAGGFILDIFLKLTFDVMSLLLRFKQVFDRIPHQRVLLKLKAHGLRNGVINWIENRLLIEENE